MGSETCPGRWSRRRSVEINSLVQPQQARTRLRTNAFSSAVRGSRGDSFNKKKVSLHGGGVSVPIIALSLEERMITRRLGNGCLVSVRSDFRLITERKRLLCT